MVETLPEGKKYINIKNALRITIFSSLIILFLYLYLGSSITKSERWLNEYWQEIKNGSCKDASLQLDNGLIRDLEIVQDTALGNLQQDFDDRDCHLKIISDDLKMNMTREQITKLKPIDILCWCRKHYDYFFQDNYEFSFNHRTKSLYFYDIKRQDKIIGGVVAEQQRDSNWRIYGLHFECSD